jgi:NMD protein affecting ribosome stability and mRNA decay
MRPRSSVRCLRCGRLVKSVSSRKEGLCSSCKNWYIGAGAKEA